MWPKCFFREKRCYQSGARNTVSDPFQDASAEKKRILIAMLFGTRIHQGRRLLLKKVRDQEGRHGVPELLFHKPYFSSHWIPRAAPAERADLSSAALRLQPPLMRPAGSGDRPVWKLTLPAKERLVFSRSASFRKSFLQQRGGRTGAFSGTAGPGQLSSFKGSCSLRHARNHQVTKQETLHQVVPRNPLCTHPLERYLV